MYLISGYIVAATPFLLRHMRYYYNNNNTIILYLESVVTNLLHNKINNNISTMLMIKEMRSSINATHNPIVVIIVPLVSETAVGVGVNWVINVAVASMVVDELLNFTINCNNQLFIQCYQNIITW